MYVQKQTTTMAHKHRGFYTEKIKDIKLNDVNDIVMAIRHITRPFKLSHLVHVDVNADSSFLNDFLSTNFYAVRGFCSTSST